MQTVFSHVIRKRYSQEYENIATDALAYILESSEAARAGMTGLLRGLVAEMPDLRFVTQQSEGAIRPDMWGYDDHSVPRVYVESKFWAGLTDNQPVSYLRQLATYGPSTVLLMIVPDARKETVWRELGHRLQDAGIPVGDGEIACGAVAHAVATDLGPTLALATWSSVLSNLSDHLGDDPAAKSDLSQLRALCDTADTDAFVPMSPEELSDQRTPALILDLNAVWQAVVEVAITKGVLHVGKLMPSASPERIGRYAQFSGPTGVGIWIGLHFRLWRKFGGTPLWMVFTTTPFGQAYDVKPILDPWAAREGVCCVLEKGELVIALDIPPGEEKDQVVRSIVDRLRAIAPLLQVLDPSSDLVDDPEPPALPDDLRDFVDACAWTYASTTPEWPHEYIVRNRVDDALFVRLVQHVRAHGYVGSFYTTPITYYDDRGRVYWTMGAPIDETIIINRCLVEDSYAYREAHGTLPGA